MRYIAFRLNLREAEDLRPTRHTHSQIKFTNTKTPRTHKDTAHAKTPDTHTHTVTLSHAHTRRLLPYKPAINAQALFSHGLRIQQKLTLLPWQTNDSTRALAIIREKKN